KHKAADAFDQQGVSRDEVARWVHWQFLAPRPPWAEVVRPRPSLVMGRKMAWAGRKPRREGQASLPPQKNWPPTPLWRAAKFNASCDPSLPQSRSHPPSRAASAGWG